MRRPCAWPLSLRAKRQRHRWLAPPPCGRDAWRPRARSCHSYRAGSCRTSPARAPPPRRHDPSTAHRSEPGRPPAAVKKCIVRPHQTARRGLQNQKVGDLPGDLLPGREPKVCVAESQRHARPRPQSSVSTLRKRAARGERVLRTYPHTHRCYSSRFSTFARPG